MINLYYVLLRITTCGFLAVTLDGCISLRNPPPEVVRRGVESIIGFLRRTLAGAVECRRTKLMIVGLGGAGKTKCSIFTTEVCLNFSKLYSLSFQICSSFN